jgi:hypothetical protein
LRWGAIQRDPARSGAKGSLGGEEGMLPATGASNIEGYHRPRRGAGVARRIEKRAYFGGLYPS